MGVYAVTVIVMGYFIRYMMGVVDRKEAVINRKDEVIEKMLPVLTEVSLNMAEVNKSAAGLLAATTELTK